MAARAKAQTRFLADDEIAIILAIS